MVGSFRAVLATAPIKAVTTRFVAPWICSAVVLAGMLRTVSAHARLEVPPRYRSLEQWERFALLAAEDRQAQRTQYLVVTQFLAHSKPPDCDINAAGLERAARDLLLANPVIRPPWAQRYLEAKLKACVVHRGSDLTDIDRRHVWIDVVRIAGYRLLETTPAHSESPLVAVASDADEVTRYLFQQVLATIGAIPSSQRASLDQKTVESLISPSLVVSIGL